MSDPHLEITPSRIRPPVLPANFLSRRHLFNLIDDRAPGYTMLVAPAGYGKTSLMAEWAAQSKKKVIWYSMSETDALNGIGTHLLSAVRQVIPGFELVQTEISVTKVFQTLANLKEDVVLVLDNVVDSFTYQLNLTQSYMDAIPDNLHIFALRRLMPTVSLQRFSSIGRLSVITAGDLIFSRSEIAKILEIHGIESSESKIDEIVLQTHGWPSAIGVIASGIKNTSNLEVDDELVKNLIIEKFNTFPSDLKELLIKMSSFEVFDLNLAQNLLKRNINEINLNKLAADGVFLMLAAGQNSSYIFNNTAREVLNEIAKQDIKSFRKDQIAASEYFQLNGAINSAISSAINSGDSEYLRKMFKPALRNLVTRGEGKKILHWSKYLPIDSTRNKIFADMTLIMGYLTNFEFDRAQQLSEELRFTYKDSELYRFIERITAITYAHISFCKGRFAEFDTNMQIILDAPLSEPDIENTDLMGMLRLLAAKAFIFEDAEKLTSVETQANAIGTTSDNVDVLFNLQAIRLMKLFLDGEYLKAYELAILVDETSERNKYFGVSASCEAIYVQARCLLEFSEVEKANIEFKRLAAKSRQWQQWPWVFMAESYLSRALIVNGEIEEAFGIIREHRKFASEFKGEDGLSLIIDQNELFLRFWVRDFERSTQILSRLPKDLLFANRYRVALSAAQNSKQKARKVPEVLSTDSARERIWKAIVECSSNIDQESKALDSLKVALDIGSRVGAKETFLRQDPKILDLIIRSASLRPTVYLEDLARNAALRMQSHMNRAGALAEPLTKREIDVLRSLASGKTIIEIGKSLHVSHNTMKTHLRNIYRKLEASGRDQAVEKAQALYII